ncbi:MAG: hypothetical protein COB56_00035 [Robiginitomaculum sp.]|nr:MAG: hypothetical protein COB56_00035 [Robiginitomaculum sp.]
MSATPQDVLDFWLNAGPKNWFAKSDDFDADINSAFGQTLEDAIAGKCDNWAETPDGTLALIILLDQFSRNLFRDDARAFAQDKKSVNILHAAIASGDDLKIREDLAAFFYMPLMHSENLSDQELCIEQMTRLNLEGNVKFAIIHRDIIRDFGRFPHRNAVLDRKTTPEEQIFLDKGGFSG